MSHAIRLSTFRVHRGERTPAICQLSCREAPDRLLSVRQEHLDDPACIAGCLPRPPLKQAAEQRLELREVARQARELTVDSINRPLQIAPCDGGIGEMLENRVLCLANKAKMLAGCDDLLSFPRNGCKKTESLSFIHPR
jgi:hypothetical protein